MTPKEKSIKVWELLRDNPGMTKEQAWIELGFDDYDPPGFKCHACIVAWNKMPGPFKSKLQMCDYCPITGWPDEEGVQNAFPNCTGGDPRLDEDPEGCEISAYDRWEWDADGLDLEYDDAEHVSKCAGYVLEAMRENWNEPESEASD